MLLLRTLRSKNVLIDPKDSEQQILCAAVGIQPEVGLKLAEKPMWLYR